MAMGSPEREELGGALQVLTGSSPTRGSRRQRTLVDAFDESALRPQALKHALRGCLNARASTNRLVMSPEAVVRPPRAYLLAAL